MTATRTRLGAGTPVPLPGDPVRVYTERPDGSTLPITFGWRVLPQHPLIPPNTTEPGERVPVLLDAAVPTGLWLPLNRLERLRERPRRGAEALACYPHLATGPAQQVLRSRNGQGGGGRNGLIVRRERPTVCGLYQPSDTFVEVASLDDLLVVQHVTDTPEYVRCNYCRRALGLPERTTR